METQVGFVFGIEDGRATDIKGFTYDEGWLTSSVAADHVTEDINANDAMWAFSQRYRLD